MQTDQNSDILCPTCLDLGVVEAFSRRDGIVHDPIRCPRRCAASRDAKLILGDVSQGSPDIGDTVESLEFRYQVPTSSDLVVCLAVFFRDTRTRDVRSPQTATFNGCELRAS